MVVGEAQSRGSGGGFGAEVRGFAGFAEDVANVVFECHGAEVR